MTVTVPSLITKAAFARLAGVTRAAVSIALSRGRVVATADGRVDLSDPTNRAYLERTTRRAPAQANGAQSQKRNRGVARAPPPPPGPADPAPRSEPGVEGRAVLPAPGGNGRSGWMHQRPPDGGETYYEADRRKKIADADKSEIANARARGILVDHRTVLAVFDTLVAIVTGQFNALAQRLGPELVVALGLTDADTMRVQELVELETRRIVSQIKRATTDWIEKHPEEPAA